MFLESGNHQYQRSLGLVYPGGGNCSVSYTINTLGGGLAALKTLTTDEGNCGGVTSYP